MTAKWSCKDCAKYDRCRTLENCYVAREMRRIDNPRRKHKVILVYESTMDKTQHNLWVNVVYGGAMEGAEE